MKSPNLTLKEKKAIKAKDWKEYYTTHRERLLAKRKTPEYKLFLRTMPSYSRKRKCHRAKLSPEQRIKNRTRNQTRYWVRVGKLKKLPCEVCKDKKSQAHHEDYSKPLQIKWFCYKHHCEVHGKKESIYWRRFHSEQEKRAKTILS